MKGEGKEERKHNNDKHKQLPLIQAFIFRVSMLISITLRLSASQEAERDTDIVVVVSSQNLNHSSTQEN